MLSWHETIALPILTMQMPEDSRSYLVLRHASKTQLLPVHAHQLQWHHHSNTLLPQIVLLPSSFCRNYSSAAFLEADSMIQNCNLKPAYIQGKQKQWSSTRQIVSKQKRRRLGLVQDLPAKLTARKLECVCPVVTCTQKLLAS